uniref:Uncharacterized protein n=1 Tax=Caenorhabditis japonica TaxID=281687 RepID=A0A8R1DPW1_CAEJA
MSRQWAANGQRMNSGWAADGQRIGRKKPSNDARRHTIRKKSRKHGRRKKQNVQSTCPGRSTISNVVRRVPTT